MLLSSHRFNLFYVLLFLSLLAIAFSACQSIGKKIGNGAIVGIKEKDAVLDSLVSGIVANARDNLLGDTTKQKVDSLLQSITSTLQQEAQQLTTSVKDSLLNEYTALRIKRIVLEAGDGLESTAHDLRNDLLGARTRLLVAQLRNELLGDSTLLAVGGLRDELLGEKTRAQIDTLLQQSVLRVANSFKEELKPQIKDTLQSAGQTVKGSVNYVAWALAILVSVLALVLAFIWRKFNTRKRIVSILTQEIDKIKDQRLYDELVGKIQQRTKKDRLESSFQEILKEEQLLQQEEWVDKDRRLLKILSDNMPVVSSVDDSSPLLQTLREEGLEEHFKSVQERDR